MEIAPHWIHPRLGLSVEELLERCLDESVVMRLSASPHPQ